MSRPAERIEELLAVDTPPLDRLMAAVCSVDPAAPTEDEIVARFDELALEVGDAASISAFLHTVFGPLGFRGNSRNYYGAGNSLIHVVLERRLGNPLSLSVVASELGRRVGIDLRPVGMPGHVLLASGSDRRWFDPFAGGAPLDRSDCEEIFRSLRPDASFHAGYLDDMTPRAAIARTLENLRVAHLRSGNRSALPAVLAVRAGLQGAPPEFRLELATVLASLGRFDAAAEQRDILADEVPTRADHHRVEAVRLRARRN